MEVPRSATSHPPFGWVACSLCGRSGSHPYNGSCFFCRSGLLSKALLLGGCSRERTRWRLLAALRLLRTLLQPPLPWL